MQYGAYRVALTAATVTTGGAVAAIANPEGADVLITRCVIHTTTKSTSAATLNVGVAADATTSADTLLDGVDVGTAVGVFDNIDDKGSNGQSCLKWGSGEYVTATASATVAGLVGYIYIEYLRTA